MLITRDDAAININTDVKMPTATPILKMNNAKQPVISITPMLREMPGLACIHFSNFPEMDSLAFSEVLYNIKNPAKQQIVEMV